MIPLTKQVVNVAYNTLSYAVDYMPESVTFDVVPKVMVHLAELLEREDFKSIRLEFGLLYLSAVLRFYVYTEEYEKAAKVRDVINAGFPEVKIY